MIQDFSEKMLKVCCAALMVPITAVIENYFYYKVELSAKTFVQMAVDQKHLNWLQITRYS